MTASPIVNRQDQEGDIEAFVLNRSGILASYVKSKWKLSFEDSVKLQDMMAWSQGFLKAH